MPEERDEFPENSSGSLDDDVPFRLPPDDALEDNDETPLEQNRPGMKPSQSDLWDRERDAHNMPTMPIPREPGTPDYKKTLPGTGGLDPNPDFEPPQEAGNTVPHQPLSENTVLNMRPVADSYPRSQPAPQRTQQPLYTPPPPQTMQPAHQAALPPRKPRAAHPQRRVLGCSPGCLMIFGGLIATFCGGLTLVTLILSATLGARLEQRLQAQVALVDEYDNFESTFFYDRNGVQLYEAFTEGRRINVDISQIPQNLIDATLAIEDDNFYQNIGIDVPATTRAMLQYVGLAEGSSGGSTITQQLVRNVLFEPEYRAERSIQRKVEEILLAILLTQRKSKEEILELYLNEIYYGNLAYGAQAAARTFFDKDVADLTLGEAALLAGLPQAPADLDPLNPDPAVQAAVEVRWRTVLDRMVTEGFVTGAQRNEALRAGLTFNEPDVPFRAQHFTLFARRELENLLATLGFGPDQIARGGLRVYTTLDIRVNDLAQQAARDQIARLSAVNNVSNAAVTVLKPVTGEILAMVGSIDYNNASIDGQVNVSISPRQPGSTLKPLTYSAALELGMSTAEIVWDTPLNITGPGIPPGWPRNYDGRFHGPMRIRQALANSYNIPAVSTLRSIGVENLLSIAQRFGIRSLGNDPSVYGLSLTLGGGEVTLLELTRAYSVFANQGAFVPTTSILCILNSDDEILYQYESSCPRGSETGTTVNQRGFGTQVLDPRVAFYISDVLGDNEARTPAMGANSPLNTGSLFSSVKTGTTDDVKDNWTVGFTRNLAVGVWVGNSRGEPMVNSSGLTGAAPIWNAVISGIYSNSDLLASFATDGALLSDQLTPPSGITLRQLCNPATLIDPATQCASSVNEWVLDSPAGRPAPDGSGLAYPPPVVQQAQQVTSGPNLVEIEPDIYRVLVHRLPQGIASQITFNVPPGQTPPPAPLYCQVPVELEPSAVGVGAQPQIFIAPPPQPDEAAGAEQYARQNNLAFLPTIACTPELLSAASIYGPNVVTAVITSPVPGQVLTNETPIIGTVQFNSDQARFYKVEIKGPSFPDWTTVGNTHSESVVNGPLENLYVPALEPGNYVVRLVLVDNNAGFLQAPYEVPFTVTR